jgi:hypothetical protein
VLKSTTDGRSLVQYLEQSIAALEIELGETRDNGPSLETNAEVSMDLILEQTQTPFSQQ